MSAPADAAREFCRALHEQARLLESAVQVTLNRTSLDDEMADRWGERWTVVDGKIAGDRKESLIYSSEADLALIRELSRRLLARNPFAINLVETGKSYIIGTGHVYRARAKPGYDLSTEKLDAVQRVIDDFIRRNRWAERQEEFWERRERDGEVFRRLFDVDGELTTRFVEPEQIRSPATGADLSADEARRLAYGVLYREVADSRGGATVDWESPEAYFVYPVSPPGSAAAETARPERVSARDIQHVKANVDASAPRGVPTLLAVETHLRRACKNLENMSVVVGMQAAIAWIRKHTKATSATIESYISNMADLATTNTLTGATQSYKKYPPGSVLDAPDTVGYEFPSVMVQVDRIVASVQAELRAVAARVQYPEFMISADASNANYSSTMVAEGPAVKKFERLQQRVIDADLEILHRQLAISALPAPLLESVDIHAQGPRVRTRELYREVVALLKLREAKAISLHALAAAADFDYEQERPVIDAEDAENAERAAAAGLPPPGSSSGQTADDGGPPAGDESATPPGGGSE